MRWPLHPLALTDSSPARGAWIAAVCALVFALFHFFGVTDVGYDPAHGNPVGVRMAGGGAGRATWMYRGSPAGT